MTNMQLEIQFWSSEKRSAQAIPVKQVILSGERKEQSPKELQSSGVRNRESRLGAERSELRTLVSRAGGWQSRKKEEVVTSVKRTSVRLGPEEQYRGRGDFNERQTLLIVD